MVLMLTPTQVIALQEVKGWLALTRNNLDVGVAAFNEALEAARIDVQPLLDAYVEAVEGARDLAFEIADTAHQVISKQPEQWHGSDEGRFAHSFYDTWNGIALDLPDGFAVPDHIQLPQHDAVSLLTKAQDSLVD